MAVKDVNGEFQNELVEGKNIVMFHADWCGPCQMTKPVVKELGEEGYNVIMLNVDENKEIAKGQGVSSIPAIHFYNGKEKVGEHVGFATKEMLQGQF